MKKGFTHENNQSDHWLTPPELLFELKPFNLDPCAYHSQPWRTAETEYALPWEDGLLLPWSGRVWCNPPYGPEVGKWANRMSLHRNGIMLVFARTETQAFRRVWAYGDAILFLYKRIAFRYPNGNEAIGGTAPSALIAFGPDNIESLRRLKKTAFNGALCTKWEP